MLTSHLRGALDSLARHHALSSSIQSDIRKLLVDAYSRGTVEGHFFSQTIIVSLVVITWRSLWNILNDVVVPNDFWLSNLVTWFGGMMLGVVLIALEPSASRLSKYLQQKHKGNPMVAHH